MNLFMNFNKQEQSLYSDFAHNLIRQCMSPKINEY